MDVRRNYIRNKMNKICGIMVCEKNKIREDSKGCGGSRVVVVNRVFREGFMEKFRKRRGKDYVNGNQGEAYFRQRILRREYTVRLRRSEEVVVVGVELFGGGNQEEVIRGVIEQVFGGYVRILGFILRREIFGEFFYFWSFEYKSDELIFVLKGRFWSLCWEQIIAEQELGEQVRVNCDKNLRG